MKKIVIILAKILSVIAISLVSLPSQKISLSYGFSILATIIERLSELDFASDLFLSLLFIAGIVFIFLKNKWFNLFGFIFMIIPLLIFSWGKPLGNFKFLFWAPLFLYISLSSYIIINKMKTE